MQISKLGVIAFFLLSSVGNARAQAQPGALIATFEEVCLASNGKQDFVRDWAERHHLAEVGGVDARKVYTGSVEGGRAWWMQVDTTFIIIALRVPSSTCAVFASAADSGRIQEFLSRLPSRFSDQWPEFVTLPEKNESGPFGKRTGRAILFTTPAQAGTLLVTLIINEHPGGPYQATLQATLSPGGLKDIDTELKDVRLRP